MRSNKMKDILRKAIAQVTSQEPGSTELPENAEQDLFMESVSKSKFKDLLENARVLFAMAKDAASGSYKISPVTYGLLVAVLVYLVNPFDLVPEGLFGPVGYVDDAMLVSWFIKEIADELAAYKAWRQPDNGGRGPDAEDGTSIALVKPTPDDLDGSGAASLAA